MMWMGTQNIKNREVFIQNIIKNVPKFSKICPKNGLKWCNIEQIGGYERVLISDQQGAFVNFYNKNTTNSHCFHCHNTILYLYFNKINN